MDVATIQSALTDAVRQIQEASGRTCPALGGRTRPIGDVDGFDSLNGIEVGALASASLGVELPENPLINKKTGRAASLEEAARLVHAELFGGAA